MSRIILLTFVFAAVVVAGEGAARGGIHQTWDQAHFAKEQTLEQVNQILDEIHARFGKDLMIETFASIPDDFKPKLQEAQAKEGGKDQFYAGWTRSEAVQLAVNGVMILITGDTRHLQIEVGLQTQSHVFTLADRDELTEKMGELLHKNDFDGSLLLAGQFVRERMARNMAGGGAAATTQPAATQPVPSAKPNDKNGARSDPETASGSRVGRPGDEEL